MPVTGHSCSRPRSGGTGLHPVARRLTRERTRYFRGWKGCWRTLIMVLSVASTLSTVSARDMIEALIAGKRDPMVLAGLAHGQMRAIHAAPGGGAHRGV